MFLSPACAHNVEVRMPFGMSVIGMFTVEAKKKAAQVVGHSKGPFKAKAVSTPGLVCPAVSTCRPELRPCLPRTALTGSFFARVQQAGEASAWGNHHGAARIWQRQCPDTEFVQEMQIQVSSLTIQLKPVLETMRTYGQPPNARDLGYQVLKFGWKRCSFESCLHQGAQPSIASAGLSVRSLFIRRHTFLSVHAQLAEAGVLLKARRVGPTSLFYAGVPSTSFVTALHTHFSLWQKLINVWHCEAGLALS
eukprot:1091161-Pelagomonas_calceolata.AAC.1